MREPVAAATSSNTAAARAPGLGLGERVAYGLGDLAFGMVMFTALTTLMYFYTELLALPAAVVGTLLFAARAGDAVWDLFVGAWIDKRHHAGGRCATLVLWGSALLVLCWLGCFAVQAAPPAWHLALACLSYVALMMSFSIGNIAYGAMPALMTDRPEDRLRLSAARAFCALSAGTVVSALLPRLLRHYGGADQAAAYLPAIAWVALLCLLLWQLCTRFSHERVRAAPRADAGAGMATDLRLLLASPIWRQMVVMTIVGLSAQMLPFGTAMYYYRHVVGNVGAAATFFMVVGACALCGVLLSDQLSRRTCKRGIAAGGKVGAGLLWASFYFVPPQQLWLGYAVAGAAALVGSLATPVLWSMPGDAADHIELQSGQRLAGLTASSLAFAQKLGMGLSSLAVGSMLGAMGHRADLAASTDVQTGIVWLMSLLPALGFLLSGWLIHRAPIRSVDLADAASRLQARRAAKA